MLSYDNVLGSKNHINTLIWLDFSNKTWRNLLIRQNLPGEHPL